MERGHVQLLVPETHLVKLDFQINNYLEKRFTSSHKWVGNINKTTVTKPQIICVISGMVNPIPTPITKTSQNPLLHNTREDHQTKLNLVCKIGISKLRTSFP